MWTALRRFWPALPVLLLGLWAARLDHLRSSYREQLIECRSGRQVDRANGDRDVAKAEASFAKQRADAAETYAQSAQAREPLIVRSTNTVREYAQTDAGRAQCLGADRVHGVDEFSAALFADHSASSGGGQGRVPADAGTAPAGR
ncbi:hypothetical protein D9601_06505 [Sphingomonas sp. MA1305]|uniref:hypothetical protein n=1 Tax=Sphingomonas sp. MA1305 TaxID=2479204 RepID=UPI0018DF9D46|nr:hypothetical protein [Sphingomonas sp. MA1305]MBI0475011.1 hypothetical protein [Sphingomonas sp. MA1305]